MRSEEGAPFSVERNDCTSVARAATGSGKPSTRFVHFAVHGVVNERFPLNSALVFTISRVAHSAEDNGLLQAWEVLEHVRLDSELVVLSPVTPQSDAPVVEKGC